MNHCLAPFMQSAGPKPAEPYRPVVPTVHTVCTICVSVPCTVPVSCGRTYTGTYLPCGLNACNYVPTMEYHRGACLRTTANVSYGMRSHPPKRHCKIGNVESKETPRSKSIYIDFLSPTTKRHPSKVGVLGDTLHTLTPFSRSNSRGRI